ncbi:MAG: hypothetical protein ACR5K4_02875 [Sodalis sp. (in: enterobacteria)]
MYYAAVSADERAIILGTGSKRVYAAIPFNERGAGSRQNPLPISGIFWQE